MLIQKLKNLQKSIVQFSYLRTFKGWQNTTGKKKRKKKGKLRGFPLSFLLFESGKAEQWQGLALGQVDPGSLFVEDLEELRIYLHL